MILVADVSVTDDALTFVFPLVVFIGVLVWGFFSRKGKEY